MERTIRTGQVINGNLGNKIPFKIDNLTQYFNDHYTNQEYADIFLKQVLETLSLKILRLQI